MDKQRLNDQLEPIYISSVPIRDVAWKTSREQWTIVVSGERGSGNSVLAAWYDDDDDDETCTWHVFVSLKSVSVIRGWEERDFQIAFNLQASDKTQSLKVKNDLFCKLSCLA